MTALAPTAPKLAARVPRPSQKPITEVQITGAFLTLWNLMAWLWQDNALLTAATEELQQQLQNWPQGFAPDGTPTTEPAPAKANGNGKTPNRSPASQKQIDFYLDLCRQAGERPYSYPNAWSSAQISEAIDGLRSRLAKTRMDYDAAVTDRQIARYISQCEQAGVAPETEDELRQLTRGALSDMIDALITQYPAA
jgi:hypothetical protein